MIFLAAPIAFAAIITITILVTSIKEIFDNE
jgi:Flp pilus assembly pilin Flp